MNDIIEINKHRKPLNKKQKDFVKMFKTKLGHVTKTCDACIMSRMTYYAWMKNPIFAEAIESEKEGLIDFVEHMLIKNINKGDTTAIIFFLKTIGKKRGYVEHIKVESDITIKGIDINILPSRPKLEDKKK